MAERVSGCFRHLSPEAGNLLTGPRFAGLNQTLVSQLSALSRLENRSHRLISPVSRMLHRRRSDAFRDLDVRLYMAGEQLRSRGLKD